MNTAANRATVQGLTIDGPSSRDLDDAIFLESNLDASYDVFVSIADVCSVVTLDSDLDCAARSRLYTRYFATGNNPMLPRDLSEDSLSLLEGQPRLTRTIRIKLSSDLEVTDCNVYPSLLISRKKFDYLSADRVIAGSDNSPFQNMLREFNSLAQRLLAARRRNGALALYDLNHGWRTTEDGQILKIDPDSLHLSNIIVQEFMILANSALAATLARADVPILYRNHLASRVAPPREQLLSDLANIMEGADFTTIETLRQKVNLVLQRAEYGPCVSGHYGLSLPVYTHATSPIRRYADLVNWRQINAWSDGQELPYSPEALAALATEINVVERKIKDARQKRYILSSNAQARSASEPGSALHTLIPTDFHRALKVCAREGKLTEAFVPEFIRRLSEPAPARNLYAVLFGATTGENSSPEHLVSLHKIREAALGWLSEHPADAVSLLATARIDLGFGQVQFTDTVSGDLHAKRFSVQANVQTKTKRYFSEKHAASSKKIAQQMACVDLLAKIVGLPKDFNRSEAIQAKRFIRNKRRSAPDNPVGFLAELLAPFGSQATYDCEMSGKPHAPNFVCTCRVAEFETKGDGRRQAIAKQAAAKAMTEFLQSDHHLEKLCTSQPAPCPETESSENPSSLTPSLEAGSTATG